MPQCLLWVGCSAEDTYFSPSENQKWLLRHVGKGSSWKRFRRAQWEVLYVLTHDSTPSAAVHSQSSCCSSLWFLAEQGSPPSMKAGLVSRNLQSCGWNAQFILGSVLNAANTFLVLGRPDCWGGAPKGANGRGILVNLLGHPPSKLLLAPQNIRHVLACSGNISNPTFLISEPPETESRTLTEWTGYSPSWRAWGAEARQSYEAWPALQTRSPATLPLLSLCPTGHAVEGPKSLLAV